MDQAFRKDKQASGKWLVGGKLKTYQLEHLATSPTPLATCH